MDEINRFFQTKVRTKQQNYALLELGRLEAKLERYKKARQCFEKLLKTNNKNYALLELGRLEAKLERYEKARQCFEKLLEIENKDYSLLELVLLDIKEKKYIDAYFKIIDNQEKFTVNIENYITYVAYQLGLLDNNIQYQNYNYLQSQIVNYDYITALKHIFHHKNSNKNKKQHSVFNPNVDIAEIFFNIQLDKKNIFNSNIVNIYVVDYKNIGINSKGNPSDNLTIITVTNTPNIITMYPVGKFDYCLDKEFNGMDINNYELRFYNPKSYNQESTKVKMIRKIN